MTSDMAMEAALLSHPLRPLPVYGHRVCLDGTNCPCAGTIVVPSTSSSSSSHSDVRKTKEPNIFTHPLCIPNPNAIRQSIMANRDMFKLAGSLGQYTNVMAPFLRQVKDSRIEALNIVQQTLVSRGIPKPASRPATSSPTESRPEFASSFGNQYNYGRKVFPCPQCRYTTDRRNNLKRHMLTMHQNTSKLLECCGILFSTKASLREHALIFHYHGYTCLYCGRRFCRKALLKRHLSVHNGQKDFVCSVCDYATSHKSNLERHRKVHFRQDGDPDRSDSELRADESFDIVVDDDTSRDDDAIHDDDNTDMSLCMDSDDEEIDVQEI